MTQKKQKTIKKKRKLNYRNITALVICFIVTCMIIGGTIGLVILGTMLSSAPKFNLDYYDTKESSQIFDQNGTLIGDVGRQIRTNVSYEDLPTSVIDAFIAVEDSRYFVHNGFDIPRFVKAMGANLMTMRFSQGGSTFSMQITKQTYFVNDEEGRGAGKDISRKVQEIALALQLEKATNKKTIFEHYVNKNNFGGSGNIRGIQKAAEYYFQKDVTELNLSESALLAGIVNSPNAFNPFNYLDRSTNRRNTVLYLMYRHGYISKSEYEIAKAIKVEDLLVDPSKQSATTGSNGIDYSYQSYIDTVIREVQTLTGMDPTSVPMKIYTYLDTDIQTTMDKIQSGNYDGIKFPDELMEIGMITVENQTGRIVAIGGGRNYGRGGSLLLNHATDQFKQPGSSIKPILDYALSFEYLGWSTSHVVTDRPINYRGTSTIIKNFNGKYYGQVPLSYAIGTSLNTPAIQALQEVIDTIPNGRETVVNYLKDLGFSKVKSDTFDLGYAIGGSSFEVSVLELAGANTVAFNGGTYIQPHTVARVEFNDGSAPLEPTYDSKEVLSDGAAYLTTQLMHEAVNGPYFNYMQILKRTYPVYGKTGTTDWGTSGLDFNIPKGAAKDKWMISATSKYSNVVWVGYEKGVKDAETYFTSAKSNLNIPGHISSALISAGNDKEKPAAVNPSSDVVSITHILGTWPYARPIEGMDQNFVTTGLIKKSFADSMVAPETANIEKLTSFNAVYSDNSNFTFNWAPYPNSDQLSVAENTMDLSLTVGSTVVQAWGPRIFDYTWIFGPIRYKVKVYNGNNLIGEYTSESNTMSQKIELNSGKQSLRFCGFYAYENLGESSNEECSTIEVNIPTATPDLTTEQGCLAAGYHWQANNCYETLPSPSPSPSVSPTPSPVVTATP